MGLQRMKQLGYKLLIFIMIFVAGCTPAQVSSIEAEQGIFDLTHLEKFEDEIFVLDGEWEFYWNKLLTYPDLDIETYDLLVYVPNAWNAYSLKGADLPGQGYATYRLHIKTGLPAGTMMGLKVHSFSSAYNLFINEKLVASNGRVSENAATEIGAYKPQVALFNIPDCEFDIIIQASNFHNARGGFWHCMSMGSADNIISLNERTKEKETFLIGALLITSLFNFAVFALSNKLRYTLYFALFCISVAVSIDMVGQFIILEFFPELSLDAILLITYSVAEWMVFLLILFMHSLYPSKVSGIFVRIYLIIAVIFQLYYIFTPPLDYTGSFYISSYIEIAGIICTIVIVSIGIKRRAKSGWLNIISILIALVTYVHDILYWTNVICCDCGEIFYVGLFLFIFIQLVIQAQRIKQYHDKKIAAELAFLQAQIKPHLLYNAINTFVSISYYDIEKARNLLMNLSSYLRSSFDLKDLCQFVPLKNEIELAKGYVELEKFRFEERIEVSFEVPEELEARVPKFILQPLIENAIIHGILPKPEGGRVDISVKKEGNYLIFRVKDNGIGMSVDKLNWEKFDSPKGIGMVNIDRRLRKLFGKGLQIKSSPGAGTELIWSIPL
ncbi:sensor histidine kinase [Phosphitispora sp. TUW77]|uniref:sensor histidine kinase n=1 Tax=Phosphitispora sp. TUW77 TaxID=3152361 RepID=UPI003AB1F97E